MRAERGSNLIVQTAARLAIAWPVAILAFAINKIEINKLIYRFDSDEVGHSLTSGHFNICNK